MKNRIYAIFFACLLIQPTSANEVNYQGYLADSAGAALNGFAQMGFKIYDADVGGALLWSEVHPSVVVDTGLYNVALGSITPLTNVPFSQPLWLEVSVGAETLSPRRQLTAAPRALSLDVPAELSRTDQGRLLTLRNTAAWCDTPPECPLQSWDGMVIEVDSRDAVGLVVTASENVGYGMGLSARSNALQGIAVRGSSTTTGELGIGVAGFADGGDGVRGVTSSNTRSGVHGTSDSSTGTGVLGAATLHFGSTTGVRGQVTSPEGKAVHGHAQASSGSPVAIYGEVEAPNAWSGYFVGGKGVYIQSPNILYDLILGGTAGGPADDNGNLSSDPTLPSSDLILYANDGVTIHLDENADETNSRFAVVGGSNVPLFEVFESGNVLVAGALVHSSDLEAKQNFSEVDVHDVLEGVASLPVSRWEYKADGVPHIGPVAQDFYATFGVGLNDRTIATVDSDGVALASIQALYQRIQELEAQVIKLNELIERQAN